MITKNTSLYNDLFDKANALLGLSKENTGYIRNIDSYFLKLGDIKEKLMEKEGKVDISYFMLPIDEPLFEINANTRAISIPAEFKNGISVQGDEIAETVFFSIDRYFDTTDFYDEFIIPVVQWKYADETGEGAYHLSATTGKAVIEDQNSQTNGKIKVVFGWPISSEVTEKAKAIQFGVRFYTIVDEHGNLIENQDQYADGTLEYSFSTLNATTKINPSLATDLQGGNFQWIDKNSLIWARMRNSKPADLNLQAIAPIVEYLIPAAGTVADLDEVTGMVTLKTKVTYPSGTVVTRIGNQIYEIRRIDFDGTDSLVASGMTASLTDDIGEDFNIDYILTKDKVRNENDQYYLLNEDGTYSEYTDPELIDGLYEKVQTYNVDRAGKYYVRIINELDSNNKESTDSKYFEIALPTTPIIGSLNDSYSAILRPVTDEETGEITYNSVRISLSVEDTDNGITPIYNWYIADEKTDNEDEMTLLNEVPLSVPEYNASEPGYYYLKALNERNNSYASAMSSNPIRVTYPAVKPTLSYLVGTYDYPMSDQQIADQVVMASSGKLTVRAESERADEYQYKWYKKGSSALVASTPSLELSSNLINNIYYCEVSSIYNGDISEATTSLEFTVVQ